MADLFEKKLKQYKEVGYVDKVNQSIVEVSGLPGVSIGETVLFETGESGQVNTLKPNGVEVLLFSNLSLKTGVRVTRGGEKVCINVGEWLLGKTINVLGRQLDGGEIKVEGKSERRDVDIVPVGISQRKKITRRMVTGVSLIDLLIPLGKGQRELVVGDRKSGKSSFLLQVITSQAQSGSYCVYAAIGKKKTEIMRIADSLVQRGARDKTILVAASSEESAGEIFLCPYTAMTIAEYLRDQGKDVLVVMDDMSTHAKFYRELSLLSHKFPGRDSYPGDIFHAHSKLLERAGNFKLGDGEASITCLPVAETVMGDIAGYIQTNLMSMTDGHIYFDTDYFIKGRRPAVNPFISVTRVGRQTLTSLSRDAGRVLMDLLNSYERTQSFLKFGAELGENSRQILMVGERVLSFFNQPIGSVVSINLQLILLAMLLSGSWDAQHMDRAIANYSTKPDVKKTVDDLAAGADSMSKLIESIRKQTDVLTKQLI